VNTTCCEHNWAPGSSPGGLLNAEGQPSMSPGGKASLCTPCGTGAGWVWTAKSPQSFKPRGRAGQISPQAGTIGHKSAVSPRNVTFRMGLNR